MIISASRRTDIPAFFSEWFMNRIREGYCCTVNPFNSNQISYIPLKPDLVEVIVFWTKNAQPIVQYLDEMDKRGYRYYFQYTITDYPDFFEPKTPSLDKSLQTFKELSHRLCPERVIWRYDPIIFTNKTSTEYHLEKFGMIAKELKDFTHRVVISIFDEYRGARNRIDKLSEQGIHFNESLGPETDECNELLKSLSEIAKENDLKITSCAEDGLDKNIIRPGKCIDNDLIERMFNINVIDKKDKTQRAECGCVQSKDIGVYDTCRHGCVFCYATRSMKTVQGNEKKHYPDSQTLIGSRLEPDFEKLTDSEEKALKEIKKRNKSHQQLDLIK